jgi:hypothetical protein
LLRYGQRHCAVRGMYPFGLVEAPE